MAGENQVVERVGQGQLLEVLPQQCRHPIMARQVGPFLHEKVADPTLGTQMVGFLFIVRLELEASSDRAILHACQEVIEEGEEESLQPAGTRTCHGGRDRRRSGRGFLHCRDMRMWTTIHGLKKEPWRTLIAEVMLKSVLTGRLTRRPLRVRPLRRNPQ